MNRHSVLLADDHRMVAEGLKGLLSSDFDLLAIAEDGRALVESARQLRPDLIVADISMPHLNGIDAMLQIRNFDPVVKFVFLTMHRDAAYARRAIESGACGYVLKHAAPAELVMALRAALQGRVFISPDLSAELMSPHRPGTTEDPLRGVSARQREILQLVAEGESAKKIASRLGLSARTVEDHKYRMMESLGLENSAELIHFAIKHGLVQ